MSILRSIRRAEAAAACRPPGDRAGKAPGAKALEGAGWRAWLKTLGPGTFTGEFADFHAGLWSWHWPVRHRLLRGEALRPDEMAALLIWSRGAGKPSHVEWCCIAEGALCGSGYVGYVSGTQAQARDHVDANRKRLESREVARHYPGLASTPLGKHGARLGWGQDYLVTASGRGIVPIGLEEGSRGGGSSTSGSPCSSSTTSTATRTRRRRSRRRRT